MRIPIGFGAASSGSAPAPELGSGFACPSGPRSRLLGCPEGLALRGAFAGGDATGRVREKNLIADCSKGVLSLASRSGGGGFASCGVLAFARGLGAAAVSTAPPPSDERDDSAPAPGKRGSEPAATTFLLMYQPYVVRGALGD